MLMVGRPQRRWMAGSTALLLIVAALAACDSSAHAGVSSTPTATATGFTSSTATALSGDDSTPSPSPTATPYQLPNPLLTPPTDPLKVCTSNGGAALTITQVVPNAALQDGERLPDTLPLKPQIYTQSLARGTLSLNQGTLLAYYFDTPPNEQIGYVCGVTMRIVAFQPLAGAVPNITLPCVDKVYLDPGGWDPSNTCPAFGLPAGDAGVIFTSSATGAIATSAMIDLHRPTYQPGQTPPWAGPNAAPDMLLYVAVPQAGTYTFSVSFWQNRSGPSIQAPNITETFTLGHYSNEWGGQQCTTASMQSQLPPPTNPPSEVICPGPPQKH